MLGTLGSLWGLLSALASLLDLRFLFSPLCFVDEVGVAVTSPSGRFLGESLGLEGLDEEYRLLCWHLGLLVRTNEEAAAAEARGLEGTKFEKRDDGGAPETTRRIDDGNMI